MNALVLVAASWHLVVNGQFMDILSRTEYLTLEQCVAWREEVNRQTASQAVRAFCLPYGGSMEDLKAIRAHSP